MFIFGKPVGYGYVYEFEIYSGKGSAAADNNLGMGGIVVINLLRIVDDLPNHSIYFDNLFTSIPLIVYLRERGIFATGTVRENAVISGSLVRIEARYCSL
jgi:hypothetical protein